MKLRTTFFNKSLFVNDLKMYIWLGIVYAGTLLFLVPMKILMLIGQKDLESVRNIYMNNINQVITTNKMKDIFFYSNIEFNTLIIMAIPAVICVFVFGYMHKKTAVDLMHVIPIRRKVQFRSHTAAAAVLIALPVLISGAISIVICAAFNLSMYYSVSDVLNWVGVTILMDILLFSISLLVGTLTGNMAVHGVLSYIVYFLPVVFSYLIVGNIKYFIYGLSLNSNNGRIIWPVLRTFSNIDAYSKGILTPTEILCCIASILVIYIIAENLYRVRKSEAASQSIAFAWMEKVFKFGATFCAMLLGGMYYIRTGRGISWAIFGYVCGAVISYFAAEMVIRKSFKVFKNVKGLVIYAVVIAAVFAGIQFDVTGYQHRVPAADRIKSVYFANYIDSSNNIKPYYEKETINSITDFHRMLVNDISSNKYRNSDNDTTIAFVYTLNDGSKLKREYLIDKKKYNRSLGRIYSSFEYKKNNNTILNASIDDITKLTISPSFASYLPNGQGITISSPEEVRQVFDIIRKGIINHKYDQREDHVEPWSIINFYIKSDKVSKYYKLLEMPSNPSQEFISASWDKYNEELGSWLKSKGYLDKARVTAKQVDYIKVYHTINPSQCDRIFNGGNIVDDPSIPSIKITNSEQIEECMKNCESRDYSNRFSQYPIAMKMKDGSELAGRYVIMEDSVPSFIKEKFSGK